MKLSVRSLLVYTTSRSVVQVATSSTKTLCQQCCSCALQHKALRSMLHCVDHSHTAVSGGVKPQRRSVLRRVCKIRWSMKSGRLLKCTDRQVFMWVHASAKLSGWSWIQLTPVNASSMLMQRVLDCITLYVTPNLYHPFLSATQHTMCARLQRHKTTCFHWQVYLLSVLGDHVGAAIHARHHQTWDRHDLHV